MSVTSCKLQHHHDRIQHINETTGLYLASVFLSVCLSSVCLSATLRKNYRPDLHENFIRDVALDKLELPQVIFICIQI